MHTPHVWIAAMSGFTPDVHDPREIVGEHVQGHLGGNLRQASSESASHPSAS